MMQLHRPWRKRRKKNDEILAVFTTPYLLKGATRKAYAERLKKELQEGIVVLSANEQLELYSKRPTNLVIEKEIT